MLAKFSRHFDGIVDCVIENLNGKTNGSIGDKQFWITVLPIEDSLSQDLINSVLKKAQKNRLYEAVANYFLRIQTQQKILTRDSVEATVPLLERMLFRPICNLKEFRAFLQERGVFDGFQQRIIKFTPNDGVTLTTLSLIMAHSCADDYILDQKAYEQTCKALKWCFSMADKLHPFLKQELSFIVVELIDKVYGRGKACDNQNVESLIIRGLIKHDILPHVLQRLVPDMAKSTQYQIARYVLATEMMLTAAILHPKLAQSASTSQLYIDFFLERFSDRFVDVLPVKCHYYAEQLKKLRRLLGKEACLTKFVPKTLNKLPKSFFEDLGTPSTQYQVLNYICVANIFSQFGRFSDYSELASVVVKLFNGEDFTLFFDDLFFLKDIFDLPEFRTKFLEHPDLTDEIFTNFYTVISFECPKEIVSRDQSDLTFAMSKMRAAGVLSVGLDPTVIGTEFHAIEPVVTVVTDIPILTFEDYRSSIEDEGEVESCDDDDDDDDGSIVEESDHVDSESEAKVDADNKEIDASGSNMSSDSRMESSSDDEPSQETAGVIIGNKYGRSWKVVTLESLRSESELTEIVSNARVEEERDKSSYDDSFFFQCSACGRKGINLFRCGRCQDVLYCDQTCQKLDWKRGHKTQCKPPA